MVAEARKQEAPLISICIGTFNRSQKVYKLVNDILLYPGNEIEVIVLDNCSTDDTKILLTKIKDPRFLFVENSKNLGGIINPIKALTLANGKYAFVCLDKDKIEPENIRGLINRLNADPGITFGICVLNLKKEKPDIHYDKGFASVLNMAYLGHHPTGFFYNSNTYKELPIVKKLLEKHEKFGFYFDLINAEMAVLGRSSIIKLPLFYTETKDECSTAPSFTYTEKDVFFSPDKRAVEFDIYLQSASGLTISKSDLAKLIKKLYNNGLMASTQMYKKIMADDLICAHYGMKSRRVSYLELWKLGRNFTNFFLCKTIEMNIAGKVYIVIEGCAKVLARSVLSK
ncbi:MAG: glycosyltransferase family 2 protein [Mucilaginibacter sp.]|uniref:glycosyltransferase family 2 protein n=1 Tax=Mucilaginibacter sp. TaxID=1882438 RepID=UPI0032633140